MLYLKQKGGMTMDWKECCIKGCDKEMRAQALCNHHYMQLIRNGHPVADEISFSKKGHRTRNGRTYRAWVSMKKRCNDPNSIGWEYYGGRGIAICDRWKHFVNFSTDMGECPEGHSIERIDNNLGYEPDNCKWATAVEQNQNKRNVKLTKAVVLEARKLFDEGFDIPSIVEQYGINYHTMYQAVKGLSWRHLNGISLRAV
jgi:hypothetical protein